MKRLLRGFGGAGGCLVLLLLCCSLISLRSCADQLSFTVSQNDSDYDPPGSTCDNAGLAYPDNPFVGWPQAGRDWTDVNFYYCAEDYYALFGRTHWGIDIQAYHGEAVYATANATVLWAYEDTATGMGRTVKICANGWCATYMHLDNWVVYGGQVVSHGQLLGYADNTGFSTGTHLHYQINHPSGFAVDPAPTFGLPSTSSGDSAAQGANTFTPHLRQAQGTDHQVRVVPPIEPPQHQDAARLP